MTCSSAETNESWVTSAPPAVAISSAATIRLLTSQVIRMFEYSPDCSGAVRSIVLPENDS